MKPSVSVSIDTITVKRGETLTVWLDTGCCGERNAIQVELRVKGCGLPEVFAKKTELSLIDFDEWEQL